jgi:glycosyltransferase involved in cell wall biosynthesis
MGWRFGAAPIIRGLDLATSLATNEFISTSRAVQDRIKRYYGRDSVIIPPPVDDIFHPSASVAAEPKSYVWAGRIVEPYKRLGILVDAFARAPHRRLIVVGEGRQRAMIERSAPKNVSFVGHMDSARLADIYRAASALILPSEDDFGMVATEAIATGTPVIAYARGGALDTIIPGISGVHFNEPSAAGILSGLDEFEQHTWNRGEVAKCGERFTATSFRQEIINFLSSLD